ncbi:MAG: NlpC/P60 family protein [candidate division Zixibacteria bacterium]|nr:NlpC/P60 family protein [candidate division Zixibacteria bacterium]
MWKKYYTRKRFIQTACSYLGTPYIWGGDDPSGFDCSGLVVESLKSVGLLKEYEDFTADGLYRKYKSFEIKKPKKGALVFYFKNDYAFHVGICLDKYFYISAIGGNSKTVTEKDSYKQNGFVKIRPIDNYKSKIISIDPFLNL